MNEREFKKFLRKVSDKKTTQESVAIVREAEIFLRNSDENKNLGQARIEDLHSVMRYFVENGKNTWKNLVALLGYSRFTGNREIEIALLEILDGSEVLNKLSSRTKKILGKKQHKEIFAGIKIPPLGTLSIEKPKITKKLMEKMEAELGEDSCREILLSGPHAGSKKTYLTERKAFMKSRNIDDFLRKRHKEYVEELEEHMNQGTLYFTQEIDKKVLDYVSNTPTCQNGVREGNIIYVTKIPYMAKKYLNEKDPQMKRYYYCHCPWVRESIRSGIEISSNFCYCSAGYEKRPWDVIFKQSVKAEVSESVLKGDLICRFAIHIPEEYTKTNKCESERKES